MPDPLGQRLRRDRVAAGLQRRLDARGEWLRDRLESREERRLLEVVRAGRDVCWVDDGEIEPLVTVRIATYNRPEFLASRAIATAVAQTYERLEILVIGDACDERTDAAVRRFSDSRIRFVNLPYQGIYPTTVRLRRMVAGSHPMNAGLVLARGSWMAPCDDDDEMTRDHVEVLLEHARRGRYEMVYSRSLIELRPGQWEDVGAVPLRRGGLAHGSVLYSIGLRFMRHSNTSWKMLEPSDWNLWRRMQRIGVRVGFLDRHTYTAYLGAVQRAELDRRT